MKIELSRGASVLLTSIAFSLFAASAMADPAATTTAPAKAVAPAATAAPAAKPAPAPATSAAATTAPAPKKVAAVSPCKGLDEKSCSGNKICSWIVPKDPNDKTGKVQAPYCRKVASAKKPATAKPAAAATGTTAPAPKTTTAVAPAVTTTAKAPQVTTTAKAPAAAPAPAQ